MHDKILAGQVAAGTAYDWSDMVMWNENLHYYAYCLAAEFELIAAEFELMAAQSNCSAIFTVAVE